MGGGFLSEEEQAEEAAGRRQMPGAVTVTMELGDAVFFDAGIIHRGWNPTGINRWTMHHVSWCADAPIMWDYDPVSSAAEVEALLDSRSDVPERFADYLRAFTEPVREKMRDGTRLGSFLDLWLPAEEADRRRNWDATNGPRDAVAASLAQEQEAARL